MLFRLHGDAWVPCRMDGEGVSGEKFIDLDPSGDDNVVSVRVCHPCSASVICSHTVTCSDDNDVTLQRDGKGSSEIWAAKMGGV